MVMGVAQEGTVLSSSFGVCCAQAGFDEDVQGGKEDDITVIVSYITKAE